MLEPEKRMINDGLDIIGERIYWEQGKVEKSKHGQTTTSAAKIFAKESGSLE